MDRLNYRSEIEILQRADVPDGYGGVTRTYNSIDSFYAPVNKAVTDYRTKDAIYYLDSGITFTTIYKFADGDDIFVKIDNILYKITKKIKQRRKYVVLCEEVF